MIRESIDNVPIWRRYYDFVERVVQKYGLDTKQTIQLLKQISQQVNNLTSIILDISKHYYYSNAFLLPKVEKVVHSAFPMNSVSSMISSTINKGNPLGKNIAQEMLNSREAREDRIRILFYPDDLISEGFVEKIKRIKRLELVACNSGKRSELRRQLSHYKYDIVITDSSKRIAHEYFLSFDQFTNILLIKKREKSDFVKRIIVSSISNNRIEDAIIYAALNYREVIANAVNNIQKKYVTRCDNLWINLSRTIKYYNDKDFELGLIFENIYDWYGEINYLQLISEDEWLSRNTEYNAIFEKILYPNRKYSKNLAFNYTDDKLIFVDNSGQSTKSIISSSLFGDQYIKESILDELFRSASHEEKRR